ADIILQSLATINLCLQWKMYYKPNDQKLVSEMQTWEKYMFNRSVSEVMKKMKRENHSSGNANKNQRKLLKPRIASRVSELLGATVRFNYTVGGDVIKVTNLEQLFRNTSQMTERVIADVIDFTQCLRAFNNICHNDKIALI
ncbi:unnamed protein product, partial [Oppiella nova]